MKQTYKEKVRDILSTFHPGIVIIIVINSYIKRSGFESSQGKLDVYSASWPSALSSELKKMEIIFFSE